jgi:hypothetical protein
MRRAPAVQAATPAGPAMDFVGPALSQIPEINMKTRIPPALCIFTSLNFSSDIIIVKIPIYSGLLLRDVKVHWKSSNGLDFHEAAKAGSKNCNIPRLDWRPERFDCKNPFAGDAP